MELEEFKIVVLIVLNVITYVLGFFGGKRGKADWYYLIAGPVILFMGFVAIPGFIIGHLLGWLQFRKKQHEAGMPALAA